jgi:L-ribulokinase
MAKMPITDKKNNFMAQYTIGVDYGTDSVRALIVETANGKEIAQAVFYYPRWKEGLYCDAVNNQFRQHPLDYLEGLETSIKEALSKAPAGTAEKIAAISVDTTGSTPVAVDEKGTPLALTSQFKDNPNAMFILWKDHTAIKEADEINQLCKTWGGIDYVKYEGGIYSSEWFWAKVLHMLRKDDAVKNAAFSWVEHCDWIPAVLSGNTNPLEIKRSRCAAGHKAMWHEDFNGLPSEEFLVKLDSRLKGIRSRLFEKTYTVNESVGNLCTEWANKLGLSTNVKIGVGAFDAHLGAVGVEIKPYYLSKVMGTSTCDMLIAPIKEMEGKLIKGICGQVDGSIVPGMLGMEAGQSAFGDIYAWFRNLLLWPLNNLLQNSSLLNNEQKEALIKEISHQIIPQLSAIAETIDPLESGIIAIDWMNGRRTPDANQLLKGAIAGLNLGSDAPRIFRALVEATAFGTKQIVDRFISEGVKIEGIIALGGVAKKSPFVMQTVADVLNMPILVARSEQACALGSAMAAAVVANIYPNIEAAQQKMSSGFETEYKPNPENVKKYKILHQKYIALGKFIEKDVSLNK